MLSQEYSDNIEQDFFPVHCCLEPQLQHYSGFLFAQYCPKSIISWDNIAQKNLYVVLSLRLYTTLHRKNRVQCCLNTLWVTIGRYTHDEDVFCCDNLTLKNSNEEEILGLTIDKS